MRIAVASDGKSVSAHFGHCEGFTVYEIDQNKSLEKSFVANPGHRPGFLPVFLKEKGVDVIIAGGMGGSAQQLFTENGIEVFVGVQGFSDDLAQAFINGNLQSSGSVCHEHQHEGSC